MKNTKLYLIIALTVILNPLFAQLENEQTITKTGTAAAQFLKIGVDPRGTAMGNAYVAMNGDVSSVLESPNQSSFPKAPSSNDATRTPSSEVCTASTEPVLARS